MKQESRAHSPSGHGSHGTHAQSIPGSAARVGRTTKVVGRITGAGDLLVAGRCEGEITLNGHLEVAPGGVVAAPIDVSALTVEGSVEGDVVAKGAVILKSAGSVRGAIRADTFALEEGARFSGRIEMNVELPSELGRGN
ncbi:MAG: hypothetical protein NVS3B20_07300 [Polyangiales bacterium]